MTSIRVIPRYVGHLWYPVLVKMCDNNKIVEMQGCCVNEWNDMVWRQKCTYGAPKEIRDEIREHFGVEE